ncbi:dihydrolipoyl dehydrogenase, partial [[Clostridium] symbiosum]|nr:dihydrolipoyl dehydrogenase [[Clostridium] symbiosum]
HHIDRTVGCGEHSEGSCRTPGEQLYIRHIHIFEAYTDTLVGAQIMCPRATDMIGEMATAIANGLTAYQLSAAMRAHPTYSEAISLAIEDALKSYGG